MYSQEEIIAVYKSYVELVYRISLMLLKNIPEAEDATQTVFLKLMKASPRLENEEHRKAWLIVTTRNTCKDMLKGWWRSKRTDLAPETLFPPGTGEAPWELWEQLGRLPEKYRILLYLYYYEGYQTGEIAVLLGLNPATVRTRMREARKKLKLFLEEE